MREVYFVGAVVFAAGALAPGIEWELRVAMGSCAVLAWVTFIALHRMGRRCGN